MLPRRTSPWSVIAVWVALSALLVHVRAYPTGAGPQACATQSPQVCHKVPPEKFPSPYSLVVKDTTYTPGTKINVTVSSDGTVGVVGFLVGAHRVTGNSTEFIGSFTATNQSQPQCGANGNTGVTHTNADVKPSVLLYWNPPSTAQGDIVFSGAILEHFGIYWVNITTGKLSPKGYAPPVHKPTTTPQPTPANGFPKHSGCGKTRACYGHCDETGTCNFLATWYKVKQSLAITLQSSVTSGDNIWAAIGFGPDASMNPASVVECVIYNGQVQAFSSNNKDYNNQRVSPNSSIGLSEVSGGIEDGVFSCTVQRQLVVPGPGKKMLNLTSHLHIMLARGNANGWTKQPHAQADAFVTQDAFDVTSHVDIGAHAKSATLMKLHGGLMAVAWIFSASIGVLVARFYKPVWPAQTVCGVKIWFAVHRVIMMVAAVATVAGVAIIFVHEGGWREFNGPSYKAAHPYLGLIVATLTVINPIMAMFRCGPTDKKRPIFNWAHFIVGTSAYIIGVVTVGIGVHLPVAEVPEYVTVCVIGFGIWHVTAHVMLEISKYCEGNSDPFKTFKELQDPTTIHEAIGFHTFRQTVFALHVMIALGVTLALVSFVINI